jgi:cyd operon protein YbgT
MLVVTAIFMPIILAYTAWVYRVLWGKVTEADVTANIRHRLLKETQDMWYFAWLLGLPLAALFAVVNAMWLELQEDAPFFFFSSSFTYFIKEYKYTNVF